MVKKETLPCQFSGLTYLSSRGYAIDKENNEEVVDYLKDLCTVQPKYNPNVPGDSRTYYIFKESSKKLYIPKALGLELMGPPSKNTIHEGHDAILEFKGILHDEQNDPVNAFLKAAKNPCQQGGILNLACGAGKCLAPLTPVIMFDGQKRFAKSIKQGDQLMGDDSRPRNVLSVCSGYEVMYCIHQDGGDDYIVNESHILSLKNGVYGTIMDIAIKDYIMLPKSIRNNLYGYRVPVEFSDDVDLVMNPYQIGLEARKLGYIPHAAQRSKKHIRLQVLEGVLESFGGSSFIANYDLVEDIAFLANSLGYSVLKTSLTGHLGLVYCQIDKHAFHLMDISIERLSLGMYCGFEIDGNGRFLLGDFTVTHNTTMSLYIACVLKKTTLVVCHKEFLIAQWRERITQFVPNARVGLIKAKICDVADKDIVLGSLQSIAMKDYDPSLFQRFGLVIIDEVHHTSAEVFSQALPKITSPIMMGLSATLDRKDGLRKVFEWFLGRPVFEYKKRIDSQVVVEAVRFYMNGDEIYMRNGKLNIAAMINQLCACTERNNLIITKLNEVLSRDPGRQVLILSDRRVHLQQLEELIDSKYSVGYYVGGMKEDALTKSTKCCIILGTNMMAAEGMDIPSLNTLILATPVSSVEQQIGRIQRQKPENRVFAPYVVDIMDDYSIFKSQALRRQGFYKRCGFIISE